MVNQTSFYISSLHTENMKGDVRRIATLLFILMIGVLQLTTLASRLALIVELVFLKIFHLLLKFAHTFLIIQHTFANYCPCLHS